MNDNQVNIPPHSLHAEQAVLGVLLKDNNIFDDIAGTLSVSDFYNAGHRVIYNQIEKLIRENKSADGFTTAEHPEIELSYCISLLKNALSPTNGIAYAKTIRSKSIQRQLIGVCYEVAESGYQAHCNEIELIADAGKKINDIANLLSVELFDNTAKAIIAETIDDMQRMNESGNEILGISTGIRELDKRINGLKDGTMVLIAARPGLGKTTFALNIVSNHAVNKGYPLVFSIEMPRKQLMKKILSSHGTIPLGKVMSADLEDHQWHQVSECMKIFKDTNLEIIDNGAVTTDMIRLECRRYLKKHGKLTMVMVDYVQLVRGKKSDNRTTQVDEISRDLKSIAKEFDCPVIVLSQLSRDIEKRADKTPLNSDLRESGQLEQDAEEIIFIHNEMHPDKVSPNDGLAKLIVSKCRMGEQGSVVTEFQGNYSRFIETTKSWNYSKPKKYSDNFKG
tara:strand:+ start:9509 stop:10858 length:1350 start_codon:yes stop_codon:yes gene_type:complete